MENWKKLHDLITYGLDKAKPMISAEQERQFTEIRGNLLQETEHVFTELNLLDEISGKAMNVLQRCVFHSRRARTIERKRCGDWKRNGTAFLPSSGWRRGS